MIPVSDAPDESEQRSQAGDHPLGHQSSRQRADPLASESSALSTYATYVGQQDPVIFGPTSVGTYEGDAGTLVDSKLADYEANAFGFLEPQFWYFTK